MNQLVSVILPVYNAEKYIESAILSILNQSLPDFELIIINDGSNDSSKQIIQSFDDKRIKYIENEKNLGLIATLNRGIKICKGKYIARMDADDISMPKRFEKQVSFLEKNTVYGICGTWASIINENNEIAGRIKNPTNNSAIRISLLFTNPIIHPSVMFQADILREFLYSSDSVHSEDYDLWCRIALLSKVKMKNLPIKLLKYRWHETNISVINSQKQLELRHKIIEKYLQSTLGPINNFDPSLHLRSFLLYKFNNKATLNLNSLSPDKKWFEQLSKLNNKKKAFNTISFNAFLWSRWIVLCLFSKKPFKIIGIKLNWLNPFVLYSTIKLLLSK